MPGVLVSAMLWNVPLAVVLTVWIVRREDRRRAREGYAAMSVDRANDLEEAAVREAVAECLDACADRLAQLGDPRVPGELRDEAAFQRGEAEDIRKGARHAENCKCPVCS